MDKTLALVLEILGGLIILGAFFLVTRLGPGGIGVSMGFAALGLALLLVPIFINMSAEKSVN
jgi:ABC-type phosphate transport system permease subunit